MSLRRASLRETVSGWEALREETVGINKRYIMDRFEAQPAAGRGPLDKFEACAKEDHIDVSAKQEAEVGLNGS
jgi:hypothetical protein